ncbi:MAG: type IV secretion system protein [Patescibacteria group bacterium]
MPKFFLKHKKNISSLVLILTISVLGVFVLGAKISQAGFFEDIIQGVLMVVGYVLLGFLWLTGQLLNVAAGLVSFFLNYTKFTEAPIVTLGWGIVKNLTNMFFVLILLAIAFATILRIESYGMKTLLPKLIIAALLINFSLVIAGPIIDFSQVLTSFFVEQSGGQDFSTKIASALNLSKITPYKEKQCTQWGNCSADNNGCLENCQLYLPTDSSCLERCNKSYCQCTGEWQEIPGTTDYDWGKGTMDTVNIIMGLIMAIIFSLVAIFAFAAFVFFLVVRILTIWFLLILAPLAWLLWILPSTQQHFSNWWNTFIKWCFFAPAYMFFVFLALKTFNLFLDSSTTDTTGTGIQPDSILPKLLKLEYLFQYLLVLGILVGGLVVAQKMGIYGAQGAIGLGKWTSKGIGAWAGRKGQRALYRPSGALGRGLDKLSSITRDSKLGRWTGLSYALGQTSRATGALGARERGAFAKSEEKFKGWTSDNLKARFKTSDGRDKAAIAKILAERGDFEFNEKLGFREADVEKGAELAKRYGKQKDIVKARPDLSDDIGKTIADLNKADMDKIQPIALKGPKGQKVIEEIIKQLGKGGNWTGSHLAKMAETNQGAVVEIRKRVIEEQYDSLRDDVKNYIKSEPGKAILGDIKPKTKTAPFSTA